MCSFRLSSWFGRAVFPAFVFAVCSSIPLRGQEVEKPSPSASEEFAAYAMKLREAAMRGLEPRTQIPTTARANTAGAYRWKSDIITTTFWVGSESRSQASGNDSACWDSNWAEHFGGFDDPKSAARIAEKDDYRPRAFEPRLNPFYFALPYNDVTKDGTQPEARTVVPWFKTAFMQEGQSVLRDRWIAIRNRANGRIAYAQWSDCGPFRTDHWQYVFGNERPRPNAGGGAGLSVSPSVRDFLGLEATDTTDWRFVEVREVPLGPWRRYGENNPFVQRAGATAKPTSEQP